MTISKNNLIRNLSTDFEILILRLVYGGLISEFFQPGHFLKTNVPYQYPELFYHRYLTHFDKEYTMAKMTLKKGSHNFEIK